MIDSIANSVVNDLCPPEGAANMPHDQMVARAYGHQILTKHKWQGLTDDEIALINADYPHPQGFARAIEAKLKEKNT